MRCDKVREELVAYLDGELPPELRDCIDSHLASCGSCRAECGALDSTGDLLGLISGETKSSLDIAGNVLKISRDGDPWCRHIQKELTAFLDSELTEEEARPVREHLADCEDCQRVSDDLRTTGVALARWTFTLPAIDLVPRLLPDYRPRRSLLRIGSLAAAATILLAVGIAALSGAFSPDQPSADLLFCMDLLDEDTLDLLEDPELVEMADEIEWLESVSDEELAFMNGSGG